MRHPFIERMPQDRRFRFDYIDKTEWGMRCSKQQTD